MTCEDFLHTLYTTIQSRKQADAASSYVASLFAKGNKKIAQKVGEEATEVVLASASGIRNDIIYESADLWFHLLVLMAAHDITPAEVLAELKRREGTSGLEEKASRTP